MARRTSRCRVAAAVLAILLLCATAADSQAARKQELRTYLAIGDSVTASTVAPGGSFAPRLYRYLRRKAHGAANRFVVAVSLRAETMLQPGGGFDFAIRSIDSPSNIVAVTLTTGGNDALGGACWLAPACPFPTDLDMILRRLNDALRRDPGRERRELLAYYNPTSGQGAAVELPDDLVLMGSDLRIDCAGSGAQVGLNDDIACIGWRNGWVVVDAWPRFRATGARLLTPHDVHPNAAGYAELAGLFENACRLPAIGRGALDLDGFLAARPAGGGPGCVGVK